MVKQRKDNEDDRPMYRIGEILVAKAEMQVSEAV